MEQLNLHNSTYITIKKITQDPTQTMLIYFSNNILKQLTKTECYVQLCRVLRSFLLGNDNGLSVYF